MMDTNSRNRAIALAMSSVFSGSDEVENAVCDSDGFIAPGYKWEPETNPAQFVEVLTWALANHDLRLGGGMGERTTQHIMEIILNAVAQLPEVQEHLK